MLSPNEALKKLQDDGKFSELIIKQEEVKTLPFGEVWNEYCKRAGVPLDCDLWEKIKEYEDEVLKKRV